MYVVLSYLVWQQERDSILPEMLHVFDFEDIQKLCTIFAGRTIKIPTLEELAESFQEVTAAYRYKEGTPEEEIAEMFPQGKDYYFKAVKPKLDEFEGIFKSSMMPMMSDGDSNDNE